MLGRLCYQAADSRVPVNNTPVHAFNFLLLRRDQMTQQVPNLVVIGVLKKGTNSVTM